MCADQAKCVDIHFCCEANQERLYVVSCPVTRAWNAIIDLLYSSRGSAQAAYSRICSLKCFQAGRGITTSNGTSFDIN